MSRKTNRPITEIVVALFLATLSAALVLIQDISVPAELRTVEGEVISRVPIYSKGNLTSFRFCIDKPRITFTYPDSAPRIDETWAAINATDHVRVLYEAHDRGNPTLWSLEISGREVANSSELRRGRINELLIWLSVFVASVGYAYWAWRAPKKAPAA